jgi:putative peptidoglycan lipid II flippase
MNNSPQDSARTIFRAAQRFFSGTLISRFGGLFRDISMAFAFGTADSAAALFVAFRFSHLLRRLLGEGALQTSFIPHFEKLRHEDPKRALFFFQSLSGALSCFLAILSLFLMMCIWSLLSLEVFSPGNAEIAKLTIFMMPSLIFICLYGVNASLLQCEQKYFIASVAPTAFNLIWIIGALLLSGLAPQNAMPWMAFCIVIACFCQWLFTVPATMAVLRSHGIQSLFKMSNWWSEDIKSLAKPLLLGIVGVGAAQINNALDAIFARWASSEGPAYLWYAIRLQQLPLALFGIAISGALLPPLSRAIKAQEIGKFHEFIRLAITRSIALMFPITIGIFLLGGPCVNLLYGRGEFSDRSIADTTLCLWGYGIGLIPMTLVLILAPAFYSRGDYRTPAIASTISVVLNIVLNTLLVGVLGYGAASVALATSISAILNYAILSRSLQAQYGSFWTKEMIGPIKDIAMASMAAASLVWAMQRGILGQEHFGALLSGSLPVYAKNFFLQGWHFLASSIVFLGIVLMLSWIMQKRARQRS